jgi:D-lactate dehydrogenase
MKITILDSQECEKVIFASALKNHQLTYLPFSADRLKASDLAKIKTTEVLSSFVYSKLDAKFLKQFPKLKLIATRSTGFDHIDLAYCVKNKIAVATVPSYGENTVAEHSFALLLSIARRLVDYHRITDHNLYSDEHYKGFDLRGKTLGVIGAGNIGKNTIRIARGFGMNVLAYDVHQDIFLSETLGYDYKDLKTVLAKSDIISLNVPYNKFTPHLINLQNLKDIKKGAVLINVSRGAVIETEALLLGLEKKIIAAAGLDVLEDEEMIIKNHPHLTDKDKANPVYKMNLKIINHPNVIFTPHIGFDTAEAVDRITNTTVDNIISFSKGTPLNLVKI